MIRSISRMLLKKAMARQRTKSHAVIETPDEPALDLETEMADDPADKHVFSALTDILEGAGAE